MSEWFANSGEEPGGKQGVISEVLCELPPKLTQRAEALLGRQLAFGGREKKVHGDDLRTFPALFNGEDVASRQRRWLGLQAAGAKLDSAFEAFGRDRDHDDFQRLWINLLAPHSPQRLLANHRHHHHDGHQRLTGAQQPGAAPAAATAIGPGAGAIPTLLLSTNGASMADRLDLYGAFASYLREQQGAYVALLRPEDFAAGVGGCFSSALAQLSGLPDSAAEDVMGLVTWYEYEIGRNSQGPAEDEPSAHPGGKEETGQGAATTATAVATPSKGATKTPGRGASKTPRGRTARGRAPGGRGVAVADVDEDAMQAGEGAGDEAAEGTVAARLRARRGQLGKAAAAAAEAEARAAREARAAAHARNRQRHVVLLVEAAGRVADRGALRALLAALHGERHRLPVTLVLGLSSPAALYGCKLPADVTALLQLTAAELAPHPLQLHRLFQDVLLSPQSPPPLLLDGATMRELLVQCRLLEPSLACLQAALLEANEQHFRREALCPLALLPLQQQQADEAAAAAAARRQLPAAPPGRGKGNTNSDDNDDSGSDSDEHDGSPASSPYASAHSQGGGDGEAEELGEGPHGLAQVDEAWLKRRRQRHCERLAAAVSELPGELLRAVSAAAAATAASGPSASETNGRENVGGGWRGKADGAARQQQAMQHQAVVREAVTEAFTALSAWRLGLRWLAALAERTSAISLPGGHRYALPSLYVAAASPRFWKPQAAAVAAAVAASCASQSCHQPQGAATGAQSAATSAALAASSLGESLLAGLLGSHPATTGAGAAAGSFSCGGGARGALRALPEEEVDLLLDDLMEAAREALTADWMPGEAVLRAAKGVTELHLSYSQGMAAEEEQQQLQDQDQGQEDGGGDADNETSPVRKRLAAQGLTSPPTAQKLQGLTERLGRMRPLPAPRLLQPNNAHQQPAQQASQHPGQPIKPAGVVPPAAAPAAAGGGASHASVKLPSSGQTQSKRQRDLALLAAVQKRAAGGSASVAAAAGADARGGGSGAVAANSFVERTAEFLGATLRELLATCPFHLPGSSAFTFRDAAGLQRRLVGAPSLALHTALVQPEMMLQELPPGLHPAQEDAAIAYQLLAGCKEGTDLRDWLADFCAASGLGRIQEIQEGGDEEDEDADKQGDGPMGRSRTSRRRHAPRKRKMAPKQEMVLALDGPQAEAAVDALACRFEQVARELEVVGLCRFSKRRKGLYVHRTYFPPEALV